MGKTNKPRGQSLIMNLPQLQNLIKRDPQSYKDEFAQQWRHYESSLAIFRLKPDENSKEFGELVTFISHIAHCYPKQCAEFPQQLIELLQNNYQVIHTDLRRTMVQSLVLMRNKDLISTTSLLSLFFTLFRCRDKTLRALLHNHIVSDIKNANAKHKNNKLNKTLQNFMYTMLKDSTEIAAKKSLDVMIELYKKNIWNDQKTVNVIAEACFSDAPKITATALHFFLGANEDDAGSDSEDEGGVDVSQFKKAALVNKKTKSRKAQMTKIMASVKRKERGKNRAEHFNFSALHLINDPQTFAEKLFARLRGITSNTHMKFEIRILFMNLISRLIGIHKLLILNFYPFLMKYLQPHQREVTAILAYAAQASHEIIPPSDIEPLVKCIGDRFVWGNSSMEVIVAGLNGIRMICERCPLAMNDELLQSLMAEGKNYKEKGIVMATRSLIQLYRTINPELLARKDRGKSATMALIDGQMKVMKYGEVSVASGIAGADILAKVEKARAAREANKEGDDEEQAGWEGWEVASDDGEELEEIGSDEEEGEEVDGDEDEEELDEEELEDGEEDEEEKADGEEQEVDAAATTTETKSDLPIEALRILTDEDFKRIRRHRLQKEAERVSGKKRKRGDEDEDAEGDEEGDDSIMDLDNDSSDMDEDEDDEGPQDFIDPSTLLAGVRRKNDYEDRMASIQSGREGRAKFGSKKGQRKAESGASLTNREKSKKSKNFIMIAHKRAVVGKKRRSLKDKSRALRAHIKKQKMKK